jgi:phytoene dehydrogenase-like protein
MSKKYDAIIVGGGHNGLVCGAYLAKSGLKALVLERRSILGGACVSEESFPGFKVSTGAFLMALLQPKIILDLELAKFGFEPLKPPPCFIPFADGRSIVLWPDVERTCVEIAQFSKKDASAYPEYQKHLRKLAPFIRQIIWETPPNMLPRTFGDFAQLAKFGWRYRKFGAIAADLYDILTLSAYDYLRRWFESDAVIATLAYFVGGGGTNMSPKMPSTAFALLRPLVRDHGTAAGGWGYMRGGMGSIPAAIAQSGARFGLETRVDAPVSHILVKDNRAAGVALESGEEITAKCVISNANAKTTFLSLVEEKETPDEFRSHVRNIRTHSSCYKVHLGVDQLPNYPSFDRVKRGFDYPGQVRVGSTVDYLERAYDDSKYGGFARKPFLTVHVPSLLDDTIAPKGMHLMSIFAGHAAYELKDNGWGQARGQLLNNTLDALETFAPGARSGVVHSEILTPVDLESRFGLPHGHVHHGEITLDQVFFRRPVPGYANYRTPVKDLYLCGASTHPGGGVTGVPGHNAAREILKDIGK